MAKVTRTPGPGAKQVQALLAGLPNVRGKTGWFESAKYEDGTPVAYVATIQEFGSAPQGIPPRPFMRPTIAEQQQAWRRSVEQGAKAVLNGRADMLSVIELLALKAAGDIAAMIASITAPPLSEATLKTRASKRASGEAPTKPLVDSGILINSVTGIAERIE